MSIVAMLVVGSCQYDDTGIWNEMEKIKDRMDTLEEAVIKTNEDIVALQAIVNALQKNVYVTSVEQTFDGSLPAFLAAFTTRKALSPEEIAQIRCLIDQIGEG